MKKRDSYDWLQLFVVAAFCIGLFANVFVSGYQILNPSSIPEQKPIQFEVTGITGTTNATTMVGVHYECIKYCVNQRGDRGQTALDECWKQCELLGKECTK